MSNAFTLAACAEMLWRDKPMQWRVKRLTEMGFQVGLWNWPEHDLAMLEKSGATFSIMNGYLRGRLTDDEGAAELLRTARETAQVGKRLGVARLNLHGTGLGDGGPSIPVVHVGVVRIHRDRWVRDDIVIPCGWGGDGSHCYPFGVPVFHTLLSLLAGARS